MALQERMKHILRRYSAFTQADIDAEIRRAPKGFEPKDKHGVPMVLKLHKALYGTKQASRQWAITLRKFLVDELKFKNSTHDPCLFTRVEKDGRKMIIGVYVDDLIVAYHDKASLDRFSKEFTGKFRASDLGPLSWFLGVSVSQGSDFRITLDQFQYIDKPMERFVPTNPGSVIKHSMPCNPVTFRRSRQPSRRGRASVRLPYLQLVGSLLCYL